VRDWSSTEMISKKSAVIFISAFDKV